MARSQPDPTATRLRLVEQRLGIQIDRHGPKRRGRRIAKLERRPRGHGGARDECREHHQDRGDDAKERYPYERHRATAIGTLVARAAAPSSGNASARIT